jgi:P pilus assembly chaperone PapD
MSMFFTLFLLLFTQDIWAFKINLIDSSLDLGQGVTSTTATIINDSNNMIAIEAGARIRKHSIDGVENFDKEAEYLLVIPSQMIIPPSGEQVISIRWVGPRKIPTEKAYRLLVEYVSVSEDKLKGIDPTEQQAGININYRIAKSFYVTPKNVQSNVIVREAKKNTVNGKDMLFLSFENTGNKHQIAHALKLEFTTSSKKTSTVFFDKEKLGGSLNFLPKESRELTIEIPNELKNTDIESVKIVNFDKQSTTTK